MTRVTSFCAALLVGLAACGNSDTVADPPAPGPDAAADAIDPLPPIEGGPIAMLLYPGFTALDLLGPHTVFVTMGTFQVDLVWKNLDPITSDTGVTLRPTR